MISYLRLFLIGIIFPSCATIIKGKRNATIMFVPNTTLDRVVLKNERKNIKQEIFVKDTIVRDVNGRYNYFKRSR